MKKIIAGFVVLLLSSAFMFADGFVFAGVSAPIISHNSDITKHTNTDFGINTQYYYFVDDLPIGFNMFFDYSYPINQNYDTLSLNNTNLSISTFDDFRYASFGLGLALYQKTDKLIFLESSGFSLAFLSCTKNSYVDNTDLKYTSFDIGGYFSGSVLYMISKHFGVNFSCSLTLAHAVDKIYIDYSDSTKKSNNTNNGSGFNLAITPAVSCCFRF